MSSTKQTKPTPVFLLKNPSEPVDRYQQVIEAASGGSYIPVFVPVLEHRLLDTGIGQITESLVEGQFSSNSPNRSYDGIIFTSQRAVAAFAVILERVKQQTKQVDTSDLLDDSSVFYVVGQATCTALSGLNAPCPIKGQETGNGAALAEFILAEYKRSEGLCRRLLFMVGETRRDIIPKTLGSTTLSADQRIQVDEVEVYQSAENANFARAFESQVANFVGLPICVAVFSPMGCNSMLEVLDLLESSSNKYNGNRSTNTKIITIGPTTRDYLVDTFSFLPQAVAKKPTPEALVEALLEAILQAH